jgi:hypothetical protein
MLTTKADHNASDFGRNRPTVEQPRSPACGDKVDGSDKRGITSQSKQKACSSKCSNQAGDNRSQTDRNDLATCANDRH